MSTNIAPRTADPAHRALLSVPPSEVRQIASSRRTSTVQEHHIKRKPPPPPERIVKQRSQTGLRRLFRCGHDPQLYDPAALPPPSAHEARSIAKKSLPPPQLQQERAALQISGAIESHNTLGIVPSLPGRIQMVGSGGREDKAQGADKSSLDGSAHPGTEYVATLRHAHPSGRYGGSTSYSGDAMPTASTFAAASETASLCYMPLDSPSTSTSASTQSFSSDGLVSSPESIPVRRVGRSACLRYHEVMLRTPAAGSGGGVGSEDVSLRRQRRRVGLPNFGGSSSTMLDVPEEHAETLDPSSQGGPSSSSDPDSHADSYSDDGRTVTFSNPSSVVFSEESSMSSLMEKQREQANAFPRTPRLYESLLPHDDPRWISEMTRLRGNAAVIVNCHDCAERTGRISPMTLPPPGDEKDADTDAVLPSGYAPMLAKQGLGPPPSAKLLAANRQALQRQRTVVDADLLSPGTVCVDLELSPNLDEAVRESCQIAASLSANNDLNLKASLYATSAAQLASIKSKHRLERTTFGDLSTFSSFSRVYSDLKGCRSSGRGGDGSDVDDDEGDRNNYNDSTIILDDGGDSKAVWSSLGGVWCSSSSPSSPGPGTSGRHSRYDSIQGRRRDSMADSRYSHTSSVCSSSPGTPRFPPPSAPLPPLPSQSPVKRSTFGEVAEATSPSPLQTIAEDDDRAANDGAEPSSVTLGAAAGAMAHQPTPRRKSSRLRVGSPSRTTATLGGESGLMTVARALEAQRAITIAALSSTDPDDFDDETATTFDRGTAPRAPMHNRHASLLLPQRQRTSSLKRTPSSDATTLMAKRMHRTI
ncbi:hypothetical protein ACQY0O_000903 [Thecaphora frezii]